MTKDSGAARDKLGTLSADRTRLLELLLDKQVKDSKSIKPYPRVATGRQIRLPASGAQQRLWFIDCLTETTSAYNIPMIVRLVGVLDGGTLQVVLDSIIQRHEALRTSFVELEGELMQEIAEQSPFPLAFVDLELDVPEQREAMVLKQSQEELEIQFDLTTAPLVRGRLFRLSKHEHVLLVTMHHIVADGWSVGLLLREVSELYTAFRAGRPSHLNPLPIQYADYVMWCRKQLGGTHMQELLSYWKGHLRGAPELLELPTDRSRPKTQSHRGGTVQVALGERLTADVRALSRQLNLTTSMILYAAWSVVLSKLSGQCDVVIGMPVANRQHTELEGLIGFFVNTLAVRIQLEDDPTVNKLLLRTREIMLAAYAHQDAPFELVVEALQPSRSLRHSPVFQVMFTLQTAPSSRTQMQELQWKEERVPVHTAQFDLSLSLQESSREISGILNYATDIFDTATAERWSHYFKTVLRSMLQDSRIPVSKLDFISEPERHDLVEIFNATHSAYPVGMLIHELFEEQVKIAPQKIAAIYEGRSYTYAQINAKANQLARYLRKVGVGTDQLVGICVDRSLEMIVGLLGILKAGAAYVPLDPSYPAERLAYMVEDSSPAMVLIQERFRAVIPRTAAPVFSLDGNWSEIAQAVTRNFDAAQLELRSDSLAYVIYTSGSTGYPKGVMVNHSNVLNLWRGLERLYALCGTCERVAMNASLNFDASVQQLVQLLSGRTLVPVPQELRRNVPALLSFLDDYRIDAIDCTPSQLRSWLTAGLLGTTRRALRVLLVGGEAIDEELWKELSAYTETQFFNVYGPTECTVDATSALVNGDITTPHIGRPMQNRRVYILNRHGQLMPVGMAGEICIGGEGVARGYLRRPQLTAERFAADMLGKLSQARIYRTGDLGRWRTDGTIEYLGRNDYQVKIRGFRIELGEIEAQIIRCDGVSEAVVTEREDVRGGKQLVAYVVPERSSERASPNAEMIRSWLKDALPEHMIPSAFVMLEGLPMTPSGKVDRRALPVPGLEAYRVAQFEPLKDEVEKRIAKIWETLLHVRRIGRQDNFFDLGGHSLLVLKALASFNQLLDVKLTVLDVYKNPTVSELAARIRGHENEDYHVDLSKEAKLGDDVVPVTGTLRLPPRSVLLTGATGFVGRFLLAQLLQESDATIYCLVRGGAGQQASQRVRAALSKWDLWREEFRDRVIEISSDLRLPRLGLDDQTYEALSASVDVVYHCATSMNHLETYAMASQANVEGARELLKLATNVRKKLVNYISTLSIFGSPPAAQRRTIHEQTSIDSERHLSSQGYVASKWVSEKIFIEASNRGVPCNIFRLGFVWADSQHGRFDELQHAYRLLKTCLLSGHGIRNYRFLMPPTPVDYVARAIVHLAREHQYGGGKFHVSSSTQDIGGVFEPFGQFAGVALRLVPHYDWISEVKRLHRAGISLPAVPLIEFSFSMDEGVFYEHQRRVSSQCPLFDCSMTCGELERGGIVAPVFNDDLLRVCVKDMLSRDSELRELTISGRGSISAARAHSVPARPLFEDLPTNKESRGP